MVRKYKLFPEASLVQLPPKDFCQRSKFVLLPCPPHRIAPLWDRGHQSRAGQMSCLNPKARTTNPSPTLYRRAASAQLPSPYDHHYYFHHLHHQSTATALSYLNYKPSPRPKQGTIASISNLPVPYFQKRSETTPVESPDSEALLDPNHKTEAPLNPYHWAQTPSVLDHLPKSLKSHDHSEIPYFNNQLSPPFHLCRLLSFMSPPPHSPPLPAPAPPASPSPPPLHPPGPQPQLQHRPQPPPLRLHLPVPPKQPPCFAGCRVKKRAKLPHHGEGRTKTAAMITSLCPVCPQSASAMRGSYPACQARAPQHRGRQTSAFAGCVHLQHRGRIVSPLPEHHPRLTALKTTNSSKSKAFKA